MPPKQVDETEIKVTPKLIWLFIKWLIGCTATVCTSVIVSASYIQGVIVDGRIDKSEIMSVVNVGVKRITDLEAWRTKVTAYYIKPEEIKIKELQN